ncbi:MAG: tetratricopeptide repeat protein [Candidatus Latescibacterota bacterium]
MTNEFLKDHPDIEKLFQRLTDEPDSHVFAPLADSCRKIGRIEEALHICEKGVEQHPEYASGLVVLGKCYYDQGERDSAKTAFQKVLLLDENNLVALKYLGMILVEQGDEVSAMERFKHILALDPENIEIRNKLEGLQETEVRVDVQDEEIEEAAGSEPMSEEEEEILVLDEILDEEFEGNTILLGGEEETSDELATLTLADIYASQGYLHKAKTIYQEVLRKWPDHSQAKAKLAALELDQARAKLPDDDGGISGEYSFDQAPMRDDEPSPVIAPPDAMDGDAGPEGHPAAVSAETDAEMDEDAIDTGADIEKFKRWIRRLSD